MSRQQLPKSAHLGKGGVAGDLSPIPNTQIPAHPRPSNPHSSPSSPQGNPVPYCKVCDSDLASIEAACRENPSCKAFTYDGNCGECAVTSVSQG